MRTLELGLRENTLVVFTSDNGGEIGVTTNAPYGKSTLYEGGLRVPAIMRACTNRRAPQRRRPLSPSTTTQHF